MVQFVLGLLLITIAALGACSSGSPPSTVVLSDLDELEKARLRWNDNEPSAYQYIITRRCLSCTPHVPGESAVVSVDSTGLQRSSSTVGDTTVSELTIASALSWIWEVIQRDFYHDRTITYDLTYGFPVSARVQDAFGHGFILTVTEFQETSSD